MDRGVTQGCLASPNASNITVDTVVSTVMLEYLETQESHNGLGWAEEEHNMVFYADNGCIAGCKPIWVHTIMMVVVSMFKRLGLQITSAILKQWCSPRVSFWRNRGQKHTSGERGGGGCSKRGRKPR